MVNPYQAPAFEPPQQRAQYQPASPLGAPPGPVDRNVSALDALRFVFADPNWWKNALYGFLLQFIPLAGPVAINGWLAETHRRLVWHFEKPVPKFSFDDFGDYLQRGWVALVAQMAVSMALLLPMMFVIGFAVALMQNVGRTQEPYFLLAVLLPVVPLSMLLPFAFLSITTLGELTERLGNALSPGQNFRYLSKIWAPALGATIVLVLLATALILAGLLACLVGVYLSIQVLQMASVHLRWQLYNESLRRGAGHVDVKAPVQLPSERRV